VKIENEADKQEFYFEIKNTFDKVVKDTNLERNFLQHSIENLKCKNTEQSVRVSQLRNQLRHSSTNPQEILDPSIDHNQRKSKSRGRAKPFR
jgi:hypothetical protein